MRGRKIRKSKNREDNQDKGKRLNPEVEPQVKARISNADSDNR